jgi:NADP-dependent 3-hydroxy acid dehydrogenase YdfG
VHGQLLRDRIVLVSGGTQGVGAGVARAAVRAGAVVVVTGRRDDIGTAFADACGLTYVHADVADVDTCVPQLCVDIVRESGV